MSSIFADQKRPRNTSPNAGGGGGSCRVSASEYRCAHHVDGAQVNFGNLPPYLGASITPLYEYILLRDRTLPSLLSTFSEIVLIWKPLVFGLISVNFIPDCYRPVNYIPWWYFLMYIFSIHNLPVCFTLKHWGPFDWLKYVLLFIHTVCDIFKKQVNRSPEHNRSS